MDFNNSVYSCSYLTRMLECGVCDGFYHHQNRFSETLGAKGWYQVVSKTEVTPNHLEHIALLIFFKYLMEFLLMPTFPSVHGTHAHIPTCLHEEAVQKTLSLVGRLNNKDAFK